MVPARVTPARAECRSVARGELARGRRHLRLRRQVVARAEREESRACTRGQPGLTPPARFARNRINMRYRRSVTHAGKLESGAEQLAGRAEGLLLFSFGPMFRSNGQEVTVTVDVVKVAQIMGGEKVLRHRVESLADLHDVVTGGLPVRALDRTVRHVAGRTGIANALKDRLVPRATRARRKRLKVVESERVERLARLMALAEQVWENDDDARAFMQESHPMLDGRTPLEMSTTELGARRVELLLARLEYSLPV